MATSSKDTRLALGDPATEHAESPAGRAGHAQFGATLTLTATLAVACVAMLMSLVLRVAHPDLSILANNFGAQQNQSAKTALYLATFAVILPLALIAVPRLTDAIADGPNGAALSTLAGLLAGAFAAALLAVKASNHLPWGDGLGVLLAVVGMWWVLAAAVLARATRTRPWPALLRMAGSGFAASMTAGVLVFGTLLCLISDNSLSPVAVALGAAIVLGVLVAYEKRPPPHLPRRWGAGADVAVIAILLLAVPDLVVFTTSSAPISPFTQPGVIQFHHDFLLGPANQVLGGGALLVNDPVSQYGVGSIYFLAGWFHLVPIGYGTYGFLDGILTALFYAAAYCVLRVSGVTRLLAGSALAVAVVALVYNLQFSVGALPQQGPLRFGLPMALILATVSAERWPRAAPAARGAGLVVVGVASIWALEAFAYTVVVFAAMAGLQACLQPAGTRLRWLARQAGLAVAACVCAHLLLATATLAGTGELPDWGQYLAYVHAFLLGGGAGDITYGFQAWSPALAVGAAYLASAAAVVLLLRRRADVVQRWRGALIALAGMTAYGIALFSYTDNRSSTYLLPYVTLPALVVGVLWLSLLLSSPQEVPRRIRLGSLAFALSVAVVLLAAAWSSVGDRFSRSAFGHAYPGGGLGGAVHRLWHPPPIDARAPLGQQLLARYMPGQRRTLVLLPGALDLSTEVLMRSKRANKLPLGDPKADSFVPSVWTPILRRAIAQLRPGDRLLVDPAALAALATLRAHPSINPLATPLSFGNALDEWILQQIGNRFDVRPIHQEPAGLIVAELRARA
ncbi:MAG: hypothetical protein M3Z95_01200 [Actinomycetota bacterium]|nr:hypothetical protein [Actinomycetota bacterium]